MKISCLVLVALISNSVAYSHHSVGGQFDREILLTFEVEVIEFQYINPHPFMTARLTDGSDDVVTLDMDNKREFDALEFDRSTFVPGDKILVGVFPTHTKSTIYYVAAIDHPRLGFRYETNVRRLLALK